jgi:hypothetical protein
LVKIAPPPTVSFPPSDRCIYCDDKVGKRTREHIIPFGLGGHLVFPQASCTTCQEEINKFEQPLQRGHFYPARVHLDFPSQNGDPRPEAFKVQFTDDNTFGVVDIRDHPCVFVLYPFVNEPAALTGAPVENKMSMSMWAYSFQPDLHARIAKIGRPVSPSQPFVIDHFCRLLAKIAHGYAAAEVGLDNFTPLLQRFILGKEPMSNRLVGGMRDMPVKESFNLHNLWLTTHASDQGSFLVATIHLFANLRGPTYRVVVGDV